MQYQVVKRVECLYEVRLQIKPGRIEIKVIYQAGTIGQGLVR